jgi:hypothetical protein
MDVGIVLEEWKPLFSILLLRPHSFLNRVRWARLTMLSNDREESYPDAVIDHCQTQLVSHYSV